jgi:hypothetical protein
MVKYHPAAGAYNEGGVLDVPVGELVISVFLFDVIQQVNVVLTTPHTRPRPSGCGHEE